MKMKCWRASIGRFQFLAAAAACCCLLLVPTTTVRGQEGGGAISSNPAADTASSGGAAAAAADVILCPMLNIVQPDTSNSVTLLLDVIFHGNVGALLAKVLLFGAVVSQQGLFAALLGGVLDLERLDEIPGVSHLDLYNSRVAEVTANVTAAADADGYVTLQDLVAIKQWVAQVQQVNEITSISQGETVFVFLGAGGDLRQNKVLATDVILFLRSEWDPDKIGTVTLLRLWRGLAMAGF